MEEGRPALLPGLRPRAQILALVCLALLVACDKLVLGDLLFSSRLWHGCIWVMAGAGLVLGLVGLRRRR